MSSRATEILKAIRSGEIYAKTPQSRAEAILKAICNDTSIDIVEGSRLETLLMCLKNGTSTTLAPRTRLEELLVAIINGTLDAFLVGKNLFNADEAYNTKEMQDGYIKYTVYTGKPNTAFFVNTNTPQEERQDGFALKVAAYDYSKTFYWLYSKNTTTGSGTVMSDEEGRISVYWHNSVGKSVDDVKKHLAKMQLTIGTSATPYSPYWASAELEEEILKTFGVDRA